MIREEKFAKVRYKARGRRLEDIAGERIQEIRWLDAPGTFSSGLSQLRATLFDRAVTSFTAARNTAEADSGCGSTPPTAWARPCSAPGRAPTRRPSSSGCSRRTRITGWPPPRSTDSGGR